MQKQNFQSKKGDKDQPILFQCEKLFSADKSRAEPTTFTAEEISFFETFTWPFSWAEILSEYVQEIPHSQTAVQPVSS